MSYLVMARRWRPQTFDDVIGQQHVTRTLQQAIRRGRVAHAYIFTGPRGVGKTTAARLLAKAVNCTNMTQGHDGYPEPCNECPACLDITSGNALDVVEIDGASNNKVDDIRTLRENIKFAPSSLPRKVYIIDEVHMLSTAAFNAMLKTLEEPPEHAMFIFATTEIHKVPATVLSRCQRFDFKRIPTKGIRQQLERIVKGDKIAIDDDALITISVKAEGALRDALSILDQLVAFQGDDPITGDVVRQALGLIGTDLYFRTTDLVATGNVAGALELTDDITGGGHDPREFLHGFQRHLMHMLFIKAGGKPEELEVADHYRDPYKEAASKLDDEDLLRIGEWAAETEDLLRDALDPQLRLELFLVKLSRMDRAVDLGALLEKLGVAPESFKHAVKRHAPAAPTASTKETTPPPQPAAATEPATSAKEKPAPAPQKQDETQAAPLFNGSADDQGSGKSAQAAPAAASSGHDAGRREAQKAATDESLDDNDDESDGSDQTDLEIDLQQIRDNWLELADRLTDLRPTVGPHLERGAPTRCDGELVEITFDQEDDFAYRQMMKARDEIRKVFREQFGAWKNITIRRGDIPDAFRPVKRKSRQEIRAEEFDKVLDDRPVWKEMVDRFDLRFEE